MSYVNELPNITKIVDKGFIKMPHMRDFKQNRRGIFWINIGVNLLKKLKFKLSKGSR